MQNVLASQGIFTRINSYLVVFILSAITVDYIAVA